MLAESGLAHSRIAALLADAGDITHVQVAVDGRWEDARRVSRAEAIDAIGILASILRPRGELAVEVFATRMSGCQTFVGVRLRDVGKDDATDLLRALLQVVARESVQLADVTTWLARKTDTALFAGKPTRVEIGVVDAWLSVGARDISTTLAASGPDPRELRTTLLAVAEGLHAPAGRVIAAEFAFDGPPAHWVGVEVARSTSSGVVASESIDEVAGVLAARA